MQGKRIPYIFAEVKAFASGISVGEAQLLSYMKVNKDVRHGIVKDDIDIKLFYANGEETIDIPPCQSQFLLDTKVKQTYINIRNRKAYDYLTNIDNESEIEIVVLASNLLLENGVDVQVPLIGDVSAGIPITAIEQFTESLILPEVWLINPRGTLALRVTGDSMIDAGIEQDDIVIVHRQDTANNVDIVIAVIAEDATMKKYLPMGSDALLVYGNPAYEPIQINSQDVHIKGKVIGVLKK